jgi:hypothetical protein
MEPADQMERVTDLDVLIGGTERRGEFLVKALFGIEAVEQPFAVGFMRCSGGVCKYAFC